jgi:flagellar FliL protein
MPEVFQNNPLIIVIIVLVLVLLIAIPVLIRRRRAGAEEVTPPIDVDQSMRDYTTEPYEEPVGFGERFRRLSIGAKLLLFLIPLVLIVAGVIGVLTLRSAGTTSGVVPQPAPSITNVQANVAGASKIVVSADTNLPDGAPVTVALKEGGQDFIWYDPDSATVQAADGKILATLERRGDGPKPRQDQEYTVVLSTQAGGRAVSSDPVALDVPAPLRNDFFQIVASAPTAKPTAPPAPTTPPAPPPPPATAAEPTAPPEPTATAAISLTASVFNGGNIRPEPRIQACSCPQLHAGEVVQLLEKTADGKWFRVIAPEGTGWVSVTLLRIEAGVARQVPLQGARTPPVPAPGGTPEATPSGLTAKVFNGGNVRATPVTGRPLDQINAGETVQLLEKTADGRWYKITTIRAVTGWVSITLLTIDDAVVRQVPIAK